MLVQYNWNMGRYQEIDATRFDIFGPAKML